MFIPIGSYYVFDDENIITLDTNEVTSTVQDAILTQPIRNMKSIEDIKEGHSMLNYLEAVINNSRLEQFEPRDSIIEENFFEPKVEGEGKVLWEKLDNGDWECRLISRGKFLGPLHLKSKYNDFKGSPFRKSSRNNWVGMIELEVQKFYRDIIFLNKFLL